MPVIRADGRDLRQRKVRFVAYDIRSAFAVVGKQPSLNGAIADALETDREPLGRRFRAHDTAQLLG